MIRVKFIKKHKQYKEGDIEHVSNNEAFGLIDSGLAIISKDMTSDDATTTSIADVPTAPLLPTQNKKFNVKEK